MMPIRRLLGWAVFLSFLGAIGALVFVFVRHAPRCTITGPLVYQHLSADGARLVTLMPKADHVRRGPLQVWDTRSGRVVHEWRHDADVLRFQPSPDDRHGAIVLGDGRLRIVDWQTGKEWCFDEPAKDEAVNRADFSPQGRWLMVVTASSDTLYLIDVNQCEVMLRMKDNWPRISDDDRLLFHRQGLDRTITVWNIQDGKSLGVVPLSANRYDVRRDGHVLLELHDEPIPAPPEAPGDGPMRGNGVRRVQRRDYRISVWDLTTFKRRFQHELKRAGNLDSVLSPDRRRLAMWLQDEKEASDLEMIDAATGQLLWSYTMKHAEHVAFAPDNSVCFLVRRRDPKNSVLTMFDADTGRVLWEGPASGSTYFAKHTNVLLNQEDFDKPLRFLDARTGALQATVPLNFRTANYIPMQTRDGRHFVIGGWQMRNREPYFWETWLEKYWPELFGDDIDGALVMETATGRELFRVVNRAKESYALSDDGSTLVTVDPGPGPEKTVIIRTWDLGATRAWWWATGIAASIGLGLLSLRCLWRGRKARKAAAGQATGSSI